MGGKSYGLSKTRSEGEDSKGKQTQFLARSASTTKYNGDYGTNNAKENIKTQRWQQGTLYLS